MDLSIFLAKLKAVGIIVEGKAEEKNDGGLFAAQIMIETMIDEIEWIIDQEKKANR